MYAFNTKQKALDWIQQYNGPRTRWIAKLNIGRLVGHTQITLYADGQFIAALEGNILGAALQGEERQRRGRQSDHAHMVQGFGWR